MVLEQPERLRKAAALPPVCPPAPLQVKEALGFGEWEVEASLSEMLLCEEDCFYRWGSQQR